MCHWPSHRQAAPEAHKSTLRNPTRLRPVSHAPANGSLPPHVRTLLPHNTVYVAFCGEEVQFFNHSSVEGILKIKIKNPPHSKQYSLCNVIRYSFHRGIKILLINFGCRQVKFIVMASDGD